jgi:hypothetical protein
MIMMTAADFPAGVTVNAFPFSDDVSHVVTHPFAVTIHAVTA